MTGQVEFFKDQRFYCNRQGGLWRCIGADVAGKLRVSRPTVSVALKALAEEGYIFVDEKTHIFCDSDVCSAKGI